MEIALKHISINNRMSEETTCFTASLYIDGVLAGMANNSGKGGCTMVHGANKFGFGLIQDAIKHCKTLPHGEFGEVSLYDVIDAIIDDEFRAKEKKAIQKRLKNDCIKHICYGNIDKGYKMHFWKGMTIEQVMNHEQGRGAMVKVIATIKAQLKEGETILNTNLGDLLK